ncbi:unnamed protein product [Adineta steineri]|uniref:Uncharacterized protein n=2 Tax=Adineta steineri TaxID=433720 RepID=A0A814IT61_9BILA|nr:unnamed protein product [Adineta steineri]
MYTFQALNTLCELINGIISQSLTRFYSTQYISAFVTTSDVFESEISALKDQFISSTTHNFLASLSAVQGTTQSNALFSSINTNYIFYGQGNNFSSSPIQYGNCSCATSATCAYQAGISFPDEKAVYLTVPGMYVGCYIFESLLQSDLRCFYDQTCINQLKKPSVSSVPPSAIALDKSLLDRFSENSTIEELINQLMVAEWNSSIIYENYYNECQPSQCTYTHQTKNSVIYIVTALVGLIGGLTTALELIVPRMVKFISFCIRKWRMRRVTTTVMPIIRT